MIDNKYFKSESIEILRSQINEASYNPRKITDQAKKTLKKGIKRFGVLGGILINKQTGYTIVSGHQRISVMDDLYKYPETDYSLRVDLIDVDEKTEKEINILMNNPNAQGEWDYEYLRELIPDIDYESAGLTEEDLNIIGVDYLLQTEEECNLAEELQKVMMPVNEQKAEIKAQTAIDKEEKKAQIKELKAQLKEQVKAKVEEMDAYVMLSFESYANKVEFMRRFGYQDEEKFIKGEIFNDQVERIE